jgi:hypothetical protein
MLPVKNTTPDISTRDFLRTNHTSFSEQISLDSARYGWTLYSHAGAGLRAILLLPRRPRKPRKTTPENNFFTGHLRREPGLPSWTRNVSRDTTQKTENNAPVFNDAS